ncbi:MAG: hypothetical protein OXN89_03315, partial [Bryobacterales bacterium]|nr:hypothetical protein [Bryobacterales bacterium]
FISALFPSFILTFMFSFLPPAPPGAPAPRPPPRGGDRYTILQPVTALAFAGADQAFLFKK